MLTIPQIEALRTSNPQLYESLKRLAGASLGPNQGWSLDSQITDGDNYARVVSGALTSGKIDPTKSGVLMRGSLPPTWSGSFTYASTTSSLTWSWTGLSIYRADGTTSAIPDGSAAVTGLAAGTTYYFYPYWDDTASALDWVAGGAGSSGFAQSAKTNSAAQQQSLQGRVPLSQGAIVAATTTSGTGGGSGGGSGSCLRAAAWSSPRTRHRADRKLQSRRTPPLPVAKRRRIVDTHHSPRSPRRRNFHPPAFLQQRIARRHPTSHLHSRRRFPHARRAPLPKRRLHRPLRPPNPTRIEAISLRTPTSRAARIFLVDVVVEARGFACKRRILKRGAPGLTPVFPELLKRRPPGEELLPSISRLSLPIPPGKRSPSPASPHTNSSPAATPPPSSPTTTRFPLAPRPNDGRAMYDVAHAERRVFLPKQIGADHRSLLRHRRRTRLATRASGSAAYTRRAPQGPPRNSRAKNRRAGNWGNQRNTRPAIVECDVTRDGDLEML